MQDNPTITKRTKQNELGSLLTMFLFGEIRLSYLCPHRLHAHFYFCLVLSAAVFPPGLDCSRQATCGLQLVTPTQRLSEHKRGKTRRNNSGPAAVIHCRPANDWTATRTSDRLLEGVTGALRLLTPTRAAGRDPLQSTFPTDWVLVTGAMGE